MVSTSRLYPTSLSLFLASLALLATVYGSPLLPSNGPGNIIELKYLLTTVPGNASSPSTFAESRCAERFASLGLKEGALKLELDLVPRNLSYSYSGDTIEITAGKTASLWVCASADNASVTIKKLGREGEDLLVNITLTFHNFRAAAMLPQASRSKYLKVLDSVLGEPSRITRDAAVWEKETYTISQTVAVKSDGEALALSDHVWLGEWIFWRKPWKDPAEPRVLLAGINYGVSYFYENGRGFTALLAYIKGTHPGESFLINVNGKPVKVAGEDTVSGYTFPLYFINATLPRAPPPNVERLLGLFGCSVKKGVEAEIRCDELLQAYKAKRGKPWKLISRKRVYGGATWSIVEIQYRGMRLAPSPMDAYKLVYWKDTGILLYMGEEPRLTGETYGFAPPPFTGYIHVNGVSVAFLGLGSPLAIRLVEARLAARPAAPVGAAPPSAWVAALLVATVSVVVGAVWALNRRKKP